MIAVHHRYSPITLTQAALAATSTRQYLDAVAANLVRLVRAGRAVGRVVTEDPEGLGYLFDGDVRVLVGVGDDGYEVYLNHGEPGHVDRDLVLTTSDAERVVTYAGAL